MYCSLVHLAKLDYSASAIGLLAVNLGAGSNYIVSKMMKIYEKASSKPAPYCTVERRLADLLTPCMGILYVVACCCVVLLNNVVVALLEYTNQSANVSALHNWLYE